MDRALWISWYNLPENGREAYLAWLYQTYIPAMLKRPGYPWAAHYASIEDGPKIPRRTSGKKILAMRIGTRMNTLTEAARVDAPELPHYRDGMAQARIGCRPGKTVDPV